jgi:crotonobetainyl-CoA:carnitine CoA-transferase CaiB-like acyl-CoA transferase
VTQNALKGIRVLDLSENLPGPYTSLLLAALGAEVIKVERPGGDPAKHLPKLYQILNRSKQIQIVDLKQNEGRDKIEKLIAKSDIIIESFRPGTLQKLGVDFEALAKIHPQLIFVSISGYGQQGPWAERPAHDLNLQAMSGFSFLERKSKKVMGKTVLPIADLSASFLAVIQILAALIERGQTQQGQRIDVAMIDALYHWVRLWSEGTHPDQWDEEGDKGKLKRLVQGSLERLRLFALPHYDIFPAKDGHVALGVVMEKKFWKMLVSEVGRNFMKDFSVPMRVISRQLIRQVLARRIGAKDLAYWEAHLASEIPLTPVLESEEARLHQAIKDRPGVNEGWTGVPLKTPEPAVNEKT